MLGKLLKQEFRATGRIMLPVFGALLALSVLGNLSIRLLDSGVTDNTALRFLAVFVIVIFVLGIFAALLVTLLLMVSRFYRNLLKEEGYLMHTLPVSVHGLVWSKLIVSLVWFILTGLVICLIVLLTGLIQSGTSLAEFFGYFPSWAEIREALSAQGIRSGDIFRFCAGTAALSLLTVLVGCLHFYAAMAMGHMFNKDKILLSIVFYVAISFVLSLFTSSFGLRIVMPADFAAESAAESIRFFSNRLLLFSLCVQGLQGVLLYFATALSLRRGLNLA